MISGWLFDVYPLGDRMILWIKNTTMHKLTIEWSPSLYVASSKENLERLQRHSKISNHIKESHLVKKTERVSDAHQSTVLQIMVKSPKDMIGLAKKIESLEKFGTYRLYNVDIPPEQSYLYENDLFPLGQYQIQDKWTAHSDITETDYSLPTFTIINLKVNAKQRLKIPKFSDKIHSIQINDATISSDSEEQMILDCVSMIKQIDPDFIITERGDAWDFPYLAYRAQKNHILDKLVLGREDVAVTIPKTKGTSYYSYGQVHFKPSASKLLGRIHIDKSNCFLYQQENSLDGIYEIARTCRMPIQTAARASIGKCMSSVQFYNAQKIGLLVPWKPTVSEIFKTRMDLLVGDRGGLILEPEVGVHENVGEVDFASLFGNIMLKKNISAETISCKCCPDSQHLVPELGYHICKRKGIVPRSLQLLLDKRQRYTELIEKTSDKENLKIYKQRKAALKWILVTSFGYLGFNNAKFGRIDAHMAVCAFARKLLMQAIRIAEDCGFRVLHGIVDSMWVCKNGATKDDYDRLRKKISEETGFLLSLDVYNWIVFLPSKQEKIVPVPNRYFGAKTDGKLKIRGIEARRHDTPEFFKECQLEILNLFSSCKTVSDVKNAITQAKKIKEKYTKKLHSKSVPLEQLAFTNRVTRGTGQHKSNTIQADAVNQLRWEGRTIEPGQKINYIINDYARKISKRVIPIEIAADDASYDAKRYSELLEECCNSVIEPFLN